jgi:signal peptidase I
VPLQSEEFLKRSHAAAEPQHTRAEAHLDLAAEVLKRFGELRLVARGSSMVPSIYPGDLVTVRSAPVAEARHGDIVLYFRDGRFWIHRLMRKWRDGSHLFFATRGDALPQEDPSVAESQVLGFVASVVRYGAPVDLARLNRARNLILGWAVRHSTAVTRALLRRHSLRVRLLGRSQEQQGGAGSPILECM